MILETIKPFNGQHCETTATGTLLNQLGINLSEPMLFGLGEGLSFLFWNMKSMDFPFLGGRIKPDVLTHNIVKNLGLKLILNETASQTKAWNQVKSLIDKGQTVGLKLDCFHLDYFKVPFHFAAHYVAIYGYDETTAYLVDTGQQGGRVRTSLESLAKARAEKGPMSSKNLYYTIDSNGKSFNPEQAILLAIRNNANDYLDPPISNVSYRGILKTSSEIIKWFKRSKNINSDFSTTAMLMEKAGTGGALFRNLYRDFLKESAELISTANLKSAYKSFVDIAQLWKRVSGLFEETAATLNIEHIYKASDILKEISVKEKRAMELLVVL